MKKEEMMYMENDKKISWLFLIALEAVTVAVCACGLIYCIINIEEDFMYLIVGMILSGSLPVAILWLVWSTISYKKRLKL